MNILLFKTSFSKVVFAAAVFGMLVTTPAKADIITTSTATPRVLQEALATRDDLKIVDNASGNGLNLSGGLFSGRASGIDPVGTNYLSNFAGESTRIDNTAELEGDPRVHALLIDGSYNINNDLGTGLPLHPYISSGVGVAMYDHGISTTNLTSQGGNSVPLFRVGGGVTYKLADKWHMSLDYIAGFSASNQLAVNGGPQATDMQSINMGMHYHF